MKTTHFRSTWTTLAAAFLLSGISGAAQSEIASGGLLDQPYDAVVSGTAIFTSAHDDKRILKVEGSNVSTFGSAASGFPYGMDVDASGGLAVGTQDLARHASDHPAFGLAMVSVPPLSSPCLAWRILVTGGVKKSRAKT